MATKPRVTFPYALGLVGVFLIIVFGGRVFYYIATPGASPSPSPSFAPNVAPSAAPSPSSSPQAAEGSLTGCAAALKAEAATKGQSYVKGSMIVVFAAGVEYAEAKTVLASYGAVVRDESIAKESFAAGRRITAAVAPGEEYAKICLLRRDGHVKFAGPETYFSLHI